MRFPPARGVIFDLDGTLVDSGLDFDEMRREMQLPPRQPILEAIARLPDEQARPLLARSCTGTSGKAPRGPRRCRMSIACCRCWPSAACVVPC